MQSAKNRRAASALTIRLILMAAPVYSASAAIPGSHAQLLKLVEQNSASYIATSRHIWEHPELGYQEFQSSAALQAALRKDGFTVTSPVFASPQLVADAHKEFERQLQGKTYRSFIAEGQKPPLDYRR